MNYCGNKRTESSNILPDEEKSAGLGHHTRGRPNSIFLDHAEPRRLPKLKLCCPLDLRIRYCIDPFEAARSFSAKLEQSVESIVISSLNIIRLITVSQAVVRFVALNRGQNDGVHLRNAVVGKNGSSDRYKLVVSYPCFVF